MDVEMSQYLARVLDVADIEEREQIAAAAQGVATLDALPPEARELIDRLERLARGQEAPREGGSES